MKTHVVMLLDESSSMAQYRSVVVSTFNEYMADLKKGTKRCFLSLFKFAGDHAGNHFQSRSMERRFAHQKSPLKEVFENRKLSEVYDLKVTQYDPDGWTPLYDSIGELIRRTKDRLPKEAKVLFVVHTDGQENTSIKYNQEDIKRMIRKCEEKRGWTFVYLGEGAQAWNAGYDFGIDNVANFSSSMRGQTMTKLARGTLCYAANSSVGGAAGATSTFYMDAGETADDIDPNDDPHVASSIHSDVVTKTATADSKG